MERFKVTYSKNKKGMYRVTLDYVLGRGSKTIREPLFVSENIAEDALKDEIRRMEECVAQLNEQLRYEMRKCERTPEKIDVEYVKNILSIVFAAEYYRLVSFLKSAKLDLPYVEDKTLLFKIAEYVFDLDEKNFDEAKSYLYPEINITEEEYAAASMALAEKALSLNQLLECYLVEIYDMNLSDILCHPSQKRGNPVNNQTIKNFLSSGIVTGYGTPDPEGKYAATDNLFKFYNTAYVIALILTCIISLKSSISWNHVARTMKKQGERWITTEGISICSGKVTKSGKKILRAYNLTPRKVHLLKLEEYAVYVLTHQRTLNFDDDNKGEWKSID